MKIPLAMFAIAAVSASAMAAGAAESARFIRLTDVATYMESTYRGEVTGVQLDASDNKPPHYHVQLRYPENRLVSFDVDAATRAVTTHDATGPMPGSAAMSEIAALVAAQLPGQLTLIEFDGGAGVAPHYDVDVRLPGGIARLKVDAKTRWIDWRQPPVTKQ